MIDETGALDVYFEDEIQILVAEPELFSVPAVEGILKELKVKYTKVQRAEA